MSYPYIPQSKEASNLYTAILACISAHVPVGLIGNPGQGKTATIQALADVMGRKLVDLSLSTMPSEDVAGIPHIEDAEYTNDDGTTDSVSVTRYAVPSWQMDIMRNPHSILFLDEFSTANHATQSAFLQIIQNRKFPGCDRPFSDDVAIVVAMNPAQQAHGTPISLPMANRFAWFPFSLPFRDWADGFANDWKSETKMKPKVKLVPEGDKRETHRKAIAKAIVAFHESVDGGGNINVTVMPTGMEHMPKRMASRSDPAEEEVFRLAYPTGRSWSNLANVLSYIDDNNTAARAMAIDGIVGTERGLALEKYLREHTGGYDIDAVLSNPKDFDWRKTTVNQKTVIDEGLKEAAKNGHVMEALAVLVEMHRQKADDLVDANLINDIIGGANMRSLSNKQQREVHTMVEDNFGDIYRSTIG